MMPPLPSPANTIGFGADNGLYTADQMRAYGAACAAAERERAAKVCDDLESRIWRAYKSPSDHSQHTEGRSDGAAECAAAIRAMPTRPPSPGSEAQTPDR